VLRSANGFAPGPKILRELNFQFPAQKDTLANELTRMTVAEESSIGFQTTRWTIVAQAGGAGGPAPADRCWIIRALIRVGLKTDAEAFAAEGLLALKGP